jgi:hypothetical protein
VNFYIQSKIGFGIAESKYFQAIQVFGRLTGDILDETTSESK